MVDMSNTKVINSINQLLHNKGIKQEDRLDTFTKCLEEEDSVKGVKELIEKIDRSDCELTQEVFMLFGNKFTKYRLDQFYTPLTISKFINIFMKPNKKAIDPAGGTGDLLVFYEGNKTICDIDENALKLCKLNYELNNQKNYKLKCMNSLEKVSILENSYNYSVLNPPFGSNTLIQDEHILKYSQFSKTTLK